MRVLYFAWVRERVGAETEEIALPQSVRTVADLADWLARRSPGHRAAFEDRNRLRAAVDQAFAPFDASVADAQEVAFFPPVTGG